MKVFENGKGRVLYLKILQWFVVVGIFVFLGKMVWENWGQIKDAPFTLRSFPFILSVFIFILSYFIQIWAWYLITLKLGIAITFRETLESWFYSQLGKYLPGKVWLLLGRFYYYESRGKSKRAVSIALYLEAVTLITAAGLIFLVALILIEEARLFYPGNQFLWLGLPFILFALVSIHPRVLQKISNWVLTKLGRDPLSLSISYPEILWILFVSILAWVVGGIGFYLFVASVFPVSAHHVLFLTGALSFSSIAGILALFAPSGLGVREGVLVYLLSSIIPASVAVIISILTRIWMTLIEIALIGMVYLFSGFQKGGKKGNPDV